MKQFSLNVATREGVGRGSSRQIRRAGGIPAVLYGKTNGAQSLSLDGREFGKLLKTIAGSSAIVEIKASEDDTRLSVIQEIQRDPRTDQILHVDLHEVSADQEMETEVVVHVRGDCIGVRVDNGILEIVSHELAVRCLPKDLPSFIEVDATDLHVGGTIHVRDLPEIPGVKFMDEADLSVVACVEPVIEEEPVAAVVEPVEGEAAAAAAEAPAAEEGAKEEPAK